MVGGFSTKRRLPSVPPLGRALDGATGGAPLGGGQSGPEHAPTLAAQLATGGLDVQVHEVPPGRIQFDQLAQHRDVLGEGADGDALDVALAVTRLATADDDTRQQTLHVPLPRGYGRLVEVVEVEHELTLGRGVKPEVADVRVAAGGDEDARVRVAAQVECHQTGGSAVEREGAREHALHAHGHELRDALRVLLSQVRHRVALRRPALGQLGSCHDAAQALAQLTRLGAAEVRAFLQQVGGIQGHVDIVSHGDGRSARSARRLSAGRERRRRSAARGRPARTFGSARLARSRRRRNPSRRRGPGRGNRRRRVRTRPR